MAAGGGFGESYSNVSDEYHDFPCYFCDKEGRNIGAVKFCVDCNYLLCSTCLGDHNKFDIMKGHQIVDKTASCGVTGKDNPDIPTLRCTEHDGKILDMFCKAHDEPCCVVCASLYHSACTEKEYLPNIAKCCIVHEEIITLNKSADNVKRRLERLRDKRADNLERITVDLEFIRSTINDKRRTINERLDAIENAIKITLDKKFMNFSSALTEEIVMLEDYIKMIGGDQDRCVSVTPNKSDSFIIAKQLKRRIRKSIQFEKDLFEVDKRLKLVETCNLSKTLKAIDRFTFGYISGSGEIESVAEESEYNISSPNDTTTSCISDSCLMPDGTIILGDQNNRCIKKLDALFHLTETLVLPGKPCAVCPTGDNEVAVSMLNKKTIQFVSTGSPMSTTVSFKVGESCRGLAYCHDKLYLSCGGMAKYHDCPGEIRVYDRSGTLIRKTDREVMVPKRMAVNSDKTPFDIFVADEKNGVLFMDISEPCVDVKSIFRHKDLVSPVGLCYTGRGQLIVCGYDSNNVMLISSSGHLIQVLLSNNDGITMPKTVCLDQTGHKLLVGMTDTELIKVVHLVRK